VLIRLGLMIAACCMAHTQTFEVASVKPATPLGPLGMRSIQSGGPGTGDTGTFSCQNCSLYWILGNAYTLHNYDYSGPDWLQTTRFDVAAKVPAGASKSDFQKMISNLLVDRFKMSTHRETRQTEIYEMTVARNGPKFKDSTPAPEGLPVLAMPGVSLSITSGHGGIRSENRTMVWFADLLSNYLRHPVRDATGLTGTYDFVFSWSWEDGPDSAENAAADIVDQLPAQLGLKVERKKGPVEVLVIDHMEKTPTPN
jgi:uncharacterized protein (TIGR03435 family)